MLHLVQKCISKGFFPGPQFQSFFRSFPAESCKRQTCSRSHSGIRIPPESSVFPSACPCLPSLMLTLLLLPWWRGRRPLCVYVYKCGACISRMHDLCLVTPTCLELSYSEATPKRTIARMEQHRRARRNQI